MRVRELGVEHRQQARVRGRAQLRGAEQIEIDREQEQPARLEHARHLRHRLLPRRDVLEHAHAVDDVGLAVFERQPRAVGAAKLDRAHRRRHRARRPRQIALARRVHVGADHAVAEVRAGERKEGHARAHVHRQRRPLAAQRRPPRAQMMERPRILPAAAPGVQRIARPLVVGRAELGLARRELALQRLQLAEQRAPLAALQVRERRQPRAIERVRAHRFHNPRSRARASFSRPRTNTRARL